MEVLPDSPLLSLADFEDSSLQTFAVADVTNCTRNQNAFFSLQGAQAYFHWKFVPVFVQGVKLNSRAHGPYAWFRKEITPMCRMVTAKTLRDEFLDFFS